MTETAEVADRAGSLVVVGTGIKAAGQITIEARSAIEEADHVYYLLADPTAEYYIKRLNPSSESLDRFYADGKSRAESYYEMVEHLLVAVRAGMSVCAAFYGHPGVFAFPPHEAIRQARAEGFHAVMLPGISAEDCLFADLGIDPANTGCQSFEATDFVVYRRRYDSRCSLILWQIGVLGQLTFESTGYESRLFILRKYLSETYPPEHLMVIYQAPHDPTMQTVKVAVALSELDQARVSPESTLYIPPLRPSAPDPEMLRALDINMTDILELKINTDAHS